MFITPEDDRDEMIEIFGSVERAEEEIANQEAYLNYIEGLKNSIGGTIVKPERLALVSNAYKTIRKCVCKSQAEGICSSDARVEVEKDVLFGIDVYIHIFGDDITFLKDPDLLKVFATADYVGGYADYGSKYRVSGITLTYRNVFKAIDRNANMC